MREFMKSNKGKIYIYIVISMLLLLVSCVYMRGLKSQRYIETEALPCEGMLPMKVFGEVEQEITAGKDFLGVGIQFYTREYVCTDDVTVEIIDADTKDVLGRFERNAESFSDEKREVFLLDKVQENVAGKSYLIKISIREGESEKHVSIGVSTQTNEWIGKPYVSKENEQDLKLEMSVCEPIIKDGYLFTAVFCIVLFLIAGYVLAGKMIKEEILLLWILGTIGLVYFLAVPMLQVPDENGHFYRSYEISQGDFLTPHGIDDSGASYLPQKIIPESLENIEEINYSKIKEASGESIDRKHKEYYANPTQALYAPISYLPQALGCLVGRLISDKGVTIFYMGRLANFIVCSLLAFWAVRLIPFGKRFLLLVICMPMYLQQMVSLSSDAFINAMALVIIALVLKIMQQESVCGKGQRIALLVISFMVALCKIVYLPLCFLVLFIPSEKLGKTIKNGRIYKTVCVAVSTVLNLGWLLIGFSYMIEFRPGVDTPAQIVYILTQPWKYLGVLCSTFATKIVDWMGTMVGAKMCILNVYTCLTLVVIYLAYLISEMIIAADEQNFLSKKYKLLQIGMFLLIFLITLTSLYVQWTAYKNPQIEGFQGRYFIPILPLLMCGLKGKKLTVSGKEILQYEWAMIAIINITTLFSIITYYMQ